MNTQLRMTPEIKFCIQYLKENNVSDGNTFESCLKKIKSSAPTFRLVPCIDKTFFVELATKMRELWPSGKKDNKWDWRESVPALVKRLQWLWENRELKKYSVEDCLLVCRKYLASYNDNTKYMKLLKYFILKRKNAEFVGSDGKIHYSYESEFANMLENLTDDERQREKEISELEAMPLDCGGVLI